MDLEIELLTGELRLFKNTILKLTSRFKRIERFLVSEFGKHIVMLTFEICVDYGVLYEHKLCIKARSSSTTKTTWQRTTIETNQHHV